MSLVTTKPVFQILDQVRHMGCAITDFVWVVFCLKSRSTIFSHVEMEPPLPGYLPVLLEA